MSHVSEDCWSAGWIGDAADAIPDLCRRVLSSQQPQRWGVDAVTVRTALGLTYLAWQLGHWVTWDIAAGDYIPYQPRPAAATVQLA